MKPAQQLSLRARITWMFVLTVAGVGCALIGIVYAYLRLTPVPFQAAFGPDAEAPVIDAAVPVTDEILRVVLTVSLAVLALLTALAGLLGWFVAGRVLAPLSAFADDARRVTSGDVDARVVYRGPDDEVGQLAAALNRMLDSLAASLAAQQRFAANASHELKTPITTIQAMADVALSDPGASADELRATLARVREVNARSAGTVASLLSLAEVQSGRPLRRGEVDLGEVCARVERERGVALVGGPDRLRLLGDAALIHTAVDNLARNAVQHGEPGTAELELRPLEGGAEVVVRNGGPLLAQGDVDRLAEPFAGSRGSTGHGLGLALAQAIAEAHGGGLELAARDGGGLEAALRVYSVPDPVMDPVPDSAPGLSASE